MNRRTLIKKILEERRSPKNVLVNLFPNPFNNIVNIKYSIPYTQNIKIDIYNKIYEEYGVKN